MSQSQHLERIGTVFLVDDEPMVTASIQTMLSLETKHLVYSFNSPGEALKKLLEYRPDVVISDFSMPEMDGITFLQQVKEQLPQSTLILLTGYADKESAIQAINTVGIYRYIEKPWDNQELKLNVKHGLERAHLVSDLKDTIHQLTEAESQLRQTNQHLEALVEARTQDLQATYQKLQSIVQNSADGIITLNQHLEITAINPTVEHWVSLGASINADHPDHHLPKALRLEDILTLPNKASVQELFNRDNSLSHLVLEAYIGTIPMEINISPLRLPESGYVLILRDITQRRDVERLREDFVSTLTHDLRTPLVAAIQTLTFFIDGTVERDNHIKREQLTDMLIQSLRDTLGLVNVLLEVYKYEGGRQRLVFEQLQLETLVKTVCEELTPLAHSRNQKLNYHLPQPLPLVTVDKQEMKRVLVNLIGNAIHHTPTGGKINVSPSTSSDKQGHPSALLEIQDNGRGIPATDLQQLFQRFSQGTSNRRSSGSGLGLYLSRQILDAHGGQIWVESEEGVGSRFFISLPLS